MLKSKLKWSSSYYPMTKGQYIRAKRNIFQTLVIALRDSKDQEFRNLIFKRLESLQK